MEMCQAVFDKHNLQATTLNNDKLALHEMTPKHQNVLDIRASSYYGTVGVCCFLFRLCWLSNYIIIFICTHRDSLYWL